MDRKVHRLAGTLFVICTLFLARHFAGAAGEGSALLGTGTLLFGGVAFLGIAIWEARDLPGLLVAQEGGAGFLPDRVLLAWLAWIGVVIGVAHLAVGLFGISLGAATSLPLVLGNVWFVVVGITFIGKRRGAETAQALEAEQQPETPPNWLERVKIIPALGPVPERGTVHPSVFPWNIDPNVEGETVADFGITLSARTEGEERLTEAEPGPGTASHVSREQAVGDSDIGSRSDLYALASAPYEMPEPPSTGTSEAWPDQVRTPVRPVPFEYATDEEEDRVGLDAEDVPQIADHLQARKVRPRTFHQWLNGGRLVGALAQALDAQEIEVRPGISLEDQEPSTIRALLAPVTGLNQAVH